MVLSKTHLTKSHMHVTTVYEEIIIKKVHRTFSKERKEKENISWEHNSKATKDDCDFPQCNTTENHGIKSNSYTEKKKRKKNPSRITFLRVDMVICMHPLLHTHTHTHTHTQKKKKKKKQ